MTITASRQAHDGGLPRHGRWHRDLSLPPGEGTHPDPDRAHGPREAISGPPSMPGKDPTYVSALTIDKSSFSLYCRLPSPEPACFARLSFLLRFDQVRDLTAPPALARQFDEPLGQLAVVR